MQLLFNLYSHSHCYSSWQCLLTLCFWLSVEHSAFIVWLFFSSVLCCSLKCFGQQTPLTFLIFSSSVNSLGISDELKQKLQDVMVDRHKLTLGKTLGEGTALFIGFVFTIKNISLMSSSLGLISTV